MWREDLDLAQLVRDARTWIRVHNRDIAEAMVAVCILGLTATVLSALVLYMLGSPA